MRAALSLTLLLALWAAAGIAGVDAEVLPPPQRVARIFAREIASGELPFHLGMTLFRAAASFVVALSVGAAIGTAMGLSPRLDRWLDSILVFFLNLPALVVVVLCYLWIGLNEAALVVAVAINKIPTAAATIREGARALDPKFFELARVFRVGRAQTAIHIVVPQLAPYFAAAARSGIALIWKIVLLVELLGRSDGIGFQINLYFQLFDVASILVYALSFIAVMLTLEWTILQPIERRVNRWRR